MGKLIALFSLCFLLSSQTAQSQTVVDWTKPPGECKGEFEERTKCMLTLIKALEGRANIAESRLAEAERLLDGLKKLNIEQRLAALESNTMKNGQVFALMSDFRKQCMHWIDTSQPAIFVPCNSGPDVRDERFVLIPK